MGMYPPADKHRRAGIDFQILVVKDGELKNGNRVQANILLNGGVQISVAAVVGQLRVGEDAVGGLVAEKPQILAVENGVLPVRRPDNIDTLAPVRRIAERVIAPVRVVGRQRVGGFTRIQVVDDGLLAAREVVSGTMGKAFLLGGLVGVVGWIKVLTRV